MIDGRSLGLISHDSRARVDKGDLHLCWTVRAAYEPLLRSPKAFYAIHRHYPAHEIVLKTSRFERAEADGIRQAFSKTNLTYSDLVWGRNLHRYCFCQKQIAALREALTDSPGARTLSRRSQRLWIGSS
jgi:hypothetical protein